MGLGPVWSGDWVWDWRGEWVWDKSEWGGCLCQETVPIYTSAVFWSSQVGCGKVHVQCLRGGELEQDPQQASPVLPSDQACLWVSTGSPSSVVLGCCATPAPTHMHCMLPPPLHYTCGD